MRKKSAHEKNANIAELELDVNPKYKKATYIICQYQDLGILQVTDPDPTFLIWVPMNYKYVLQIRVVKIFRARTCSLRFVPTHQCNDGSAQVSHLSKGNRTTFPIAVFCSFSSTPNTIDMKRTGLSALLNCTNECPYLESIQPHWESIPGLLERSTIMGPVYWLDLPTPKLYAIPRPDGLLHMSSVHVQYEKGKIQKQILK
jgi:hypothetical protein